MFVAEEAEEEEEDEEEEKEKRTGAYISLLLVFV